MNRSTLMLAVWALLLGGEGAVQADSIAYNLVDYVGMQTGAAGSTDDISGQIVTDGAPGSFSSGFASHIMSASLTLTTPSGTYVVPSAEAVFSSLFPTDFVTTPSALSMVGGGYFSLLGLTSQRDLIDVTWYNSLASGSQANPHIIIDFIKADLSEQFSTIISPPVTDGIESNNTWVLAVLGSSSVPEPAVTMGLCTSLLGLGAVHLRQRKAKT